MMRGKSKNTLSFYTERTVRWDGNRGSVSLIDQTLLPNKFKRVSCETVDELVNAIKTMKVRGAPAIGVAGAMGVLLAVKKSNATSKKQLLREIKNDCEKIRNARPTAVNLSWGVDQVLSYVKEESPENIDSNSRAAIEEFVNDLADSDVSNNIKLSDIGEKLFRDGDVVLTHCK